MAIDRETQKMMNRRPVSKAPVRTPVRQPARQPVRPVAKPVVQQPKPKQSLWGTIKGVGGNVLGSVGNNLATPFDKKKTDKLGTWIGQNVLQPVVDYVPGVNSAFFGRVPGTNMSVKEVLMGAGNVVQKVSGVSDYQEAVADAQKGNWKGAGANLIEGLDYAFSTASGAKMAGNLLGRQALRYGMRPLIKAAPTTNRFLSNPLMKYGVIPLGKIAGTGFTGFNYATEIPNTFSGPQATKPSRGNSYTDDLGTHVWNPISNIYELRTLAQQPRRGNSYTDDLGTHVWNPTSRIYELRTLAKQPPRGQSYTDDLGTHVWNPISGIYELRTLAQQPTAGTPAIPVAPTIPVYPPTDSGDNTDTTLPTDSSGYEDPYSNAYDSSSFNNQGGYNQPAYSQELAGLSPEEMEELLNAAREAQRDYDSVLNQVTRNTAQGEADFTRYMRGVNRQTAGSAQDTNSALAQLGMDMSPAAQGFNQYTGAEGGRQIAGARANLAKVLANLREQRGQAEAVKLRRLREIDAATAKGRARRTVSRIDSFM